MLSGKVFVLAAVGACVLLAGFAALRQSQTTQRIRELWGAEGASAIQNASQVTWLRPAPVGTSVEPIDLSSAAGLVHLRATLVDDVYLQPASQSGDSWEVDNAEVHRIEFAAASKSVLVELHLESGKIHCEETGNTATLIPASRDAVLEYFGKLAGKYSLRTDSPQEAN
ncbi:MAG: hypothetical protein Aurels2KO_35720 [Aureliella sp.]